MNVIINKENQKGEISNEGKENRICMVQKYYE